MRFAFLGADSDSLELLIAIVQDPTHSVVACYGVDPSVEDEFRKLAPDADWGNNWESLLHEPLAEVVIVSTWRKRSETENQLRADQLRKLVQSAMPLIVIQPGCEAIVGFEVDMIRNDTHSLIVPYYPAKSWIPFVGWMRADQGEIAHVSLERRATDWSPVEVRVQLARDIYMLGRLLGRIQRVNAFGTALRGGPGRLTVNFESESGATGQWSIATAADSPPVRVAASGEFPTATAILQENNTWEVTIDGNPTVRPPDNAAQALLGELPGLLTKWPAHSWSTACRAQEIAELAERSAERGRTLELYHEEHSEQETFKGVMAVGSCALLMLTLMVLVIGSIVEGIRLPYAEERQPISQPPDNGQADNENQEITSPAETSDRPVWMRLWPVYPLLIFLLLQSLRLAFPQTRKKTLVDSPESTGSGADNSEY